MKICLKTESSRIRFINSKSYVRNSLLGRLYPPESICNWRYAYRQSDVCHAAHMACATFLCVPELLKFYVVVRGIVILYRWDLHVELCNRYSARRNSNAGQLLWEPVVEGTVY